MFLASGAEIISIGAVVPFISVLLDPELVLSNDNAQYIIQLLGITTSDELILPLTIVFIGASLFSGAIRLLLLWATTRLSFATGADISFDIYRRTLYQPYKVHIERNSSELISGITTKAHGVVIHVVMPILNILTSIFLMTGILFVLITINPAVAILSMIGFGLIYVVVAFLTSKRLFSNSRAISRESTEVIKILQEGLGGIRDILIDGSQANYAEKYRAADLQLQYTNGNNQFIAQSPRYGMESLGIVLIASLAYFLALQPNGIATAMPVLGALAIGAQRLLPLLQRSYLSWAMFQGGTASLIDTLDLLDQPQSEHIGKIVEEKLLFEDEISFKNMSFRYNSQTPWVLKDLNLNIKKGNRIGLIGTTGSGKTTLLDIFMGLLSPTNGTFEIDGKPIVESNVREWQAHIAHVPQNIYLADTTIQENIAFGLSAKEIDMDRLRWAAEQANISDKIESFSAGYETIVGERGIKLSGGQQQRIGIARALYKRADVIVFDEATSALDNETEQSVMSAIENISKDLTIIIIAHRLSTLKNCSHIIELGNAGITRIGNYEEVVLKSNDF